MSKISKIDVLTSVEVRNIEGNKLEVKGFLPSNSFSEVLFHPKKRLFFKERIKTGAFATAINESIPKLLLNHNKYEEFKSAEFTELKETKKGLEFIAIVDNEYELIDNLKDVRGLSFGFIVDDEIWSKVDDDNIRDIFTFKELIEISVLVGRDPAYSSSKVIILPEGTADQLDELEKYKLFLREEYLKMLKEEIEEL